MMKSNLNAVVKQDTTIAKNIRAELMLITPDIAQQFLESNEHNHPPDVIYGERTGNVFHPTEKPVNIMRQIVGFTSGQVFDPFMGSGTTSVACAKMGRSFIGIEREEKYCMPENNRGI